MTYYQTLNVHQDATNQNIREAYRRLAFEYHPDRNAENPLAAEKMKEINEAYAVLSDPDKRRQYDAMFHQYGHNANDQFRQSYSEQEIFKGSDIHQIFEEMAKSFGLRGFDEIFKGYYGQNYRSFEFRHSGFSNNRFLFGRGINQGKKNIWFNNLLSNIFLNIFHKISGFSLPHTGANLYDAITITPDLARMGGPFVYLHPKNKKKLVVHIPSGIRKGQTIRLTGLGKQGQYGGAAGDLMLKVRIKKTILNRIKDIFSQQF